MQKALAVLLCLAAPPVLADMPESDGIAVQGLLSDADFYRLVTCGAPPGGACRAASLRWTKPSLTLAIAPAANAEPPGFRARLVAAAQNAIDEVNAIGAGIRIDLIPAGPADITIRPTALTEGAILSETPGFSGAGVMGVGYMTVWSNAENRITEAVILISTSISDADLTSVMLEEVTQSLGFLFDIEGPAYEGVSILSQTSNATTRLTGQDAMLLRRHYPPNRPDPAQDQP
ncbi:DUF2927 domain-containing protein [Tabrizicola sp. YIM 78059]|uniref:DUF2927 domain-containing protein n=1 Tax=Tabrizicola sp. YIM 78059 TaxID=2529861 RepID=UPI0010AB0AAF|nr:DUF2927 domain-containing protein [Tabrizicola sp. YIM 78059]